MIEIRNLNKTYISKDSETTALNSINITLPDKGLVFITGKSGSGKSTLLNLIGGLDVSTYGEIIYNGASLNEFSLNELAHYRKEVVGFIFQDFALVESMNVYDNIAIALEMISSSDYEEVDKVMENLEIDNLRDRMVNKLSAGQKQRVAIARACVKKPSIILADEPTGNLDSYSGKIVLNYLRKLASNSLVIIVSHNKNESFRYADLIINLEKGNINSTTYCESKERFAI